MKYKIGDVLYAMSEDFTFCPCIVEVVNIYDGLYKCIIIDTKNKTYYDIMTYQSWSFYEDELEALEGGSIRR